MRTNRWGVVVIALMMMSTAWAASAQDAGSGDGVSAPMSASGLVEFLQSERITMDLKDAQLENVLRILAAQYDLNIVAGADVQGTMTISFKDATLAGALKAMLSANGYGYIVEGNIMRVAKAEAIATEQKNKQESLALEDLVTEVFYLKYMDAKDAKEVLDPLLTARGKVTVVLRKGFKGFQFGQITSLTAGGAGGGSGSGSGTTTTTATTGGSDGGGGSGGGITKSGEGGEKSSILVVQDVAATMAKVKRILRQIDTRPRQILIKSRMFEINADDIRDVGFEFSTGSSGLESSGTPPVTAVAVEKHDLGPPPEDTQTVRTLLQGGGIARFFDSSGNFGFGRDGQDGLQLRLQKLTGAQFDTLIRAVESNQDFNELSSPSIMVLENQEAAILVGEQFPIFEVQAASTDTATPVESLSYFQPVGVSLQVIPQVVGEDLINMVIHPSVSSISTFVTGSTGLQAPRITIREADTQVMVRTGETLVMGGMIQDKRNERVVGIPFLMELPFLGNFFKRTQTSDTKVELIIFITPEIILEPDFDERQAIAYEMIAEKEAIKSTQPADVIVRKIRESFD